MPCLKLSPRATKFIELALILGYHFFFWENFNLWRPLFDNSSLLSDQDTNQFFGVGEGLNLESLIQPLKTLSVKLVETYY